MRRIRQHALNSPKPQGLKSKALVILEAQSIAEWSSPRHRKPQSLSRFKKAKIKLVLYIRKIYRVQINLMIIITECIMIQPRRLPLPALYKFAFNLYLIPLGTGKKESKRKISKLLDAFQKPVIFYFSYY